jgi:cell division protein FtsN
MPKDYKSYVKTKKTKASGKKLWILSIILVLILAGLVFLLLTLSQKPLKSGQASKEVLKKVVPVVKPKEEPKIHFEFYSLLTKPNSGASAPNTAPESSSNLPKVYVIQVASIQNFSDADTLKAKLLLNGYTPLIQKNMIEDETWYRVQIGPFDKNEVLVWQKKLAKSGFEGLIKKAS